MGSMTKEFVWDEEGEFLPKNGGEEGVEVGKKG